MHSVLLSIQVLGTALLTTALGKHTFLRSGVSAASRPVFMLHTAYHKAQVPWQRALSQPITSAT